MATLRDRYGKSLDTRTKDAKSIAGEAASNKAGLANKAAKQSAAMSNASKMTQALMGSQAANDAIQSGYNEGINTGAAMAAQVAQEEANAKAREIQQQQFEATQAFNAEQAQKDRDFQKSENDKQRKSQWINQIIGGLLGGLF